MDHLYTPTHFTCPSVSLPLEEGMGLSGKKRLGWPAAARMVGEPLMRSQGLMKVGGGGGAGPSHYLVTTHCKELRWSLKALKSWLAKADSDFVLGKAAGSCPSSRSLALWPPLIPSLSLACPHLSHFTHLYHLPIFSVAQGLCQRSGVLSNGGRSG